MDPLTAHVRIVVLTEELAAAHAEALLAMTHDSAWDDWTEDNLLSPRPEKWTRSLLGLVGDAPAGWAIASRTPNAVHLHHLVVAPELRGRRIGEALVEELLARSRDAGLLTLKVHPDNDGALRFYGRLGFVDDGPSPSGYRQLRRLTDDRAEVQ